MRDPRRQMLEAFAKVHGNSRKRSWHSMQITPGGSERAFNVMALGVLPAKRELIVSAPTNEDGALIAVYQGLHLQCSWFNSRTLFRFGASVAKVVFEPEPLLYLHLSEHTQQRAVRTTPRAPVNLPAVLRTPKMETVLLTDCSVTGARIAILKDTQLQVGDEVELSVKPKLLLEMDVLLTLKCIVMGEPEAAPDDFPDIVFRGLKFVELSERDRLALHAYVQQSLVGETDMLAPVLLRARNVTEMNG